MDSGLFGHALIGFDLIWIEFSCHSSLILVGFNWIISVHLVNLDLFTLMLGILEHIYHLHIFLVYQMMVTYMDSELLAF